MIVAWIIGGFGAIFNRRHPRLTNLVTYISASVGSMFGIITALFFFITSNPFFTPKWQVTQHISFHFAIDELSAFFLLLISVVGLVVSIFSPSYVNKFNHKKSVHLLGFGYNLFLLSMVGVVTSTNGFTFLVTWEMMSIISFFLVIFAHEQNEVRQSGLLYVIMTHLGTGFIIISFLILFLHQGTLDFTQLHVLSEQLNLSTKNIIFILAFIGFATKAGLVPLHIWLPRAHPVAPTHVSALMSSVMIKTAFYGLLRLINDLVGAPALWAGVIVLIVGILSAMYGILYGVVQLDIKRFLAFSSIENMGLIFASYGSSLIFTILNEPVFASFALLAALYHTLNHAFFKGLLFMGAGAVYNATGTRNMEKLGGLIRYMPRTTLLFLIGSLAMASLPPLNGFISKWLTFQSLVNIPFQIEGSSWLSLIGTMSAVALLFVGALVALGIIKLFSMIFLAQARTEKVENAIESPLPMRIAMGIMTFFIVLLGLFPGVVASYIQRITGIFYPNIDLSISQTLSIETISEVGSAIQPVHLIIGFIIIGSITIFMLFLTLGKSKYTTEEPWACGVSLRPEMSYSGMSFSHPLLLIFKPIFGNVFTSKMIQQRVILTLQMRKIFSNLLYEPIVRFVMIISQQIRRIQDGSIHSYLAYIFVTLIVMLLIVTKS